MPINPLQVALWTFRRNESDVVNLYNSLSKLMQLATGGDMLNFGYWQDDASDPAAAQRGMCSLVGDIAELSSARRLADIGSGLSAPALQWESAHGAIEISCVNINLGQLLSASRSIHERVAPGEGAGYPASLSLKQQASTISLLNATCTALPFSDHSVDRIIALESAQHFRPLDRFVEESRRILEPDGLLVIAMPVMAQKAGWLQEFFKLGILSFTWSSEHYGLDYVKSAITGNGFEIKDVRLVGHRVYEPLANYYSLNRAALRHRILREYPSYLENVLYKSLTKMKDVSRRGVIDYVIIKAAVI